VRCVLTAELLNGGRALGVNASSLLLSSPAYCVTKLQRQTLVDCCCMCENVHSESIDNTGSFKVHLHRRDSNILKHGMRQNFVESLKFIYFSVLLLKFKKQTQTGDNDHVTVTL